MIKKIIGIYATLLVLAIACKKETICTQEGHYNVTNFSMTINSTNRGLFTGEGTNTSSTIGSIRNQFIFIPEKSYIAQVERRSGFGWDIFTSAYAARDCVVTDYSLTNFDPAKTSFSINRSLDLSLYGLGTEIIPAGTNLLSNQAVRTNLLNDIASNIDLHAGIEIPISVSKEFLTPLNGEKIQFTLSLTTTTGTQMSSSVEATVDLNA